MLQQQLALAMETLERVGELEGDIDAGKCWLRTVAHSAQRVFWRYSSSLPSDICYEKEIFVGYNNHIGHDLSWMTPYFLRTNSTS